MPVLTLSCDIDTLEKDVKKMIVNITEKTKLVCFANYLSLIVLFLHLFCLLSLLI